MTASAGTLPVPQPLTSSGFSARANAMLNVCLPALGDPATYQETPGGPVLSLLVVLGTATDDTKQSPNLSRTPIITADIRIADLPSPLRGAALVVGDATYKLTGIRDTDLTTNTVGLQRV